MDATHILRMMVERLEPEVGSITLADFGYWGDDEPSELSELTRSGRCHLACALRYAKEALTSGDPERIESAARVAPTYERTGREMAAKYLIQQHHTEAQDKRRRGGSARGDKQSTDAQQIWAPWQKRFQELTSEGKPPGTARRIVQSEMARSFFVLQGSGESPSDRTLRKWLK